MKLVRTAILVAATLPLFSILADAASRSIDSDSTTPMINISNELKEFKSTDRKVELSDWLILKTEEIWNKVE